MGSEGSGCGQLSVELLRKGLFSLSLIFGASFGCRKVLVFPSWPTGLDLLRLAETCLDLFTK